MRPFPGERIPTDTGDVIVYEIRAHARGYYVRGVERVLRDLMPADEIRRRWAHKRFCRKFGVAA